MGFETRQWTEGRVSWHKGVTEHKDVTICTIACQQAQRHFIGHVYVKLDKYKCFKPAAGEKKSGSKVKLGKARRRRKFFQKMRGG